MQALIAGIVAAFAGILVGFWLRSTFAKSEKAQAAQRTQELAGELALLRRAFVQAQSDAIARAGFESLAVERESTIRQLNFERAALQKVLDAKTRAEQEQ